MTDETTLAGSSPATPAEPAAPAVDNPPEPTATPTDATATPTAPELEHAGFQARIDELTRDKYELAEQAKRAQEALDQIQQQDPLQPLEQELGPMPLPEQFGYDDQQFVAAQRAWTAKALQHGEQQRQQQAHLEQQRQAHMTRQQRFTETAMKGAEKYPDWQISMYNAAPMDQMIPDAFDAALAQENAADVLHFYAKNPGEVYRLSGLDPVQRGIEVYKASQRLSTPTSTKGNPPPAPPPGSGLPQDLAPTGLDEADMTPEQYDAHVRKRWAERRNLR